MGLDRKVRISLWLVFPNLIMSAILARLDHRDSGIVIRDPHGHVVR